MSSYKFDGRDLRLNTGKVGSVDGKYIRDSHGTRFGEFDAKIIRDAHGSKIAEFDGKNIHDAHGSRIGTIDDVRKAIDGVGGMSMVALWMLLVR